MVKYLMLQAQLMEDGVLAADGFFTPQEAAEQHIIRVHSQRYVEEWRNLRLPETAVRRTGFPQSAEVVKRELLITGGTLEAAHIALKHGVAFNLAGGTHHAHHDFGAAYCLLNDVGISAAYAIHELKLRSVLIMDLDVHQGDGTAVLFKDVPEVFTCSVHGEGIWPRNKVFSDLDVALPASTRGTAYLNQLKKTLRTVLYSARPELMFYIAGADVLEGDKLGNLALSEADCQLRDRLVFEACKTYGIPVVVTMGGGYAPQVQNVVNVHKNTFREGLCLYHS